MQKESLLFFCICFISLREQRPLVPSAKYLRRSQRYEKSRAKQRNSFFFCRDGV